MTAQRRNLDFADVDAVNQDLALLKLVVAADQRENRALARARRADKRHGLVRVNVEGHALQHPLAREIAEPDVAELDFALYLVQLDGVGGVHHFGRNVHDGEHLLRRGQRRLQPIELFGQILDGREEFGNVHVERDDGAARDALAQKRHAVQMPHAAEIKKTQDRADIQHVDQRTKHAEHKDLLPVRAGEALTFLAELRHLLVLAAKDLRDLDAGQILRQVGVDVGGRILDLAVGPAGELAEDDRKNHDERHKAEHHQCQLIVERQHGDQDAEDDEDVLGQRDQQVREHHRDSVRIVRHAGDELADGNLVQLLVGQRLNVGE